MTVSLIRTFKYRSIIAIMQSKGIPPSKKATLGLTLGVGESFSWMSGCWKLSLSLKCTLVSFHSLVNIPFITKQSDLITPILQPSSTSLKKTPSSITIHHFISFKWGSSKGKGERKRNELWTSGLLRETVKNVLADFVR